MRDPDYLVRRLTITWGGGEAGDTIEIYRDHPEREMLEANGYLIPVGVDPEDTRPIDETVKDELVDR